MGYVTCGEHPRRRCCWSCDKCPVCDGVKILRGDYCEACTAKIKAAGGIWSEFHQDYIPSETLFKPQPQPQSPKVQP